jgi:hypothetical protein
MAAKIKYEYSQSVGNYGVTYIAPSLRHEKGSRAWFKCHCGKEFESRVCHVKTNNSSSCGCRRARVSKEKATTHGLADKHPLYSTWRAMMERCANVNCRAYKNYGSRGIKVCDRWSGRDGFPNFLEDMGEKPSPSHSLDRIDNNQGYSKENCRWATKNQQARNTRSSRIIYYQGMNKTLAEWAEILDIPKSTLLNRINRSKWSINKAFNTPVREHS